MSTDTDWDVLDDSDGPPVFCPKCEALGLVHDVEWIAHSEYACTGPDCDYLWSCGDDGRISDRERL